MNRKKILVFALGGALLVGSLTGCNTAAASQNKVSQPGTTSSQMSGTSTKITVAFAEGDDSSADVSYEELFQPYEQFGLTYDSDKNELQYKGKTVRWFEDYYTVEDGGSLATTFSTRMAWLMCMPSVTSRQSKIPLPALP